MADVRTLFCPNCGAPIHHGDLECEYCGAGLYAGRAAEVTVPALAEAQKIIPEMQVRIKRNPYDGDAYYQLGLACFTLKLYTQAEDAFEQAERFSPGDALVHYFAGLAALRRAERACTARLPRRSWREATRTMPGRSHPCERLCSGYRNSRWHGRFSRPAASRSLISKARWMPASSHSNGSPAMLNSPT
jgi:hypothetical protein